MKKYIYTTHIFNFKATTLNETQPNDFMKYYYLKFSLNILFDNIIWRGAYLVDRQKCNCSRMKLWIFLADNSSKCTHKIAAIIFKVTIIIIAGALTVQISKNFKFSTGLLGRRATKNDPWPTLLAFSTCM